MKKQTNPNIKAHLLRGVSYLLLLLTLACFVFTGKAKSAFNPDRWLALSQSVLPGNMTNPATQARTLTFADRVAYQRAIEEVYWQHRIWPKENAGPKPPLDKVMSQAEIEKKVEDYLRNSQALEDYWQRPITPDQLQAEMERMSRHTKQPEVLRELFEALGNDPFVIAECLARATLVERLTTDANSKGGSSPARRSDAKAANRPRAIEVNRPYLMSMTAASGNAAKYILPTISQISGDNSCTDDSWTTMGAMDAPDGRHLHTAIWTGSEMIVWGGYNNGVYFNTGGRYNPSTDTWTATSTSNAPAASYAHTAIWTGSEMVVWGGGGDFDSFNTGGR